MTLKARRDTRKYGIPNYATFAKTTISDLQLPQFTTRRNFEGEIHLFEKKKGEKYDTILWWNLMTKLEIVLDYKKEYFAWRGNKNTHAINWILVTFRHHQIQKGARGKLHYSERRYIQTFWPQRWCWRANSSQRVPAKHLHLRPQEAPSHLQC